ncbi:YegP family protein [uncultured Tenacibaculum sp.]|uniref:YegP family protein n=2 Tax=Tenacibaculum TaxID=104267 RepID=UPI00263126B6|nr:YegP family protein [uncultured Tenacibaculum sp.]
MDSVLIKKINEMGYPKFTIKKSENDKYYFNLYAKNYEVIATSQMYKTKSGCINGINSVKINAPEAEIEDMS